MNAYRMALGMLITVLMVPCNVEHFNHAGRVLGRTEDDQPADMPQATVPR